MLRNQSERCHNYGCVPYVSDVIECLFIFVGSLTIALPKNLRKVVAFVLLPTVCYDATFQ